MKEDDDPEKRIADLERRLAEPRAAEKPREDRSYPSGPASAVGGLTPEQVRNVAFSKPPFGKRGYNEDEVDAFLDGVEAAMSSSSSSQGGLPPPPQATFSAAPEGGGSPTRHARPESRSHRFQDNAFNIIGRIVDFITDPAP
jgi:DivIVA domain-containing protein